MMKMCAKRHNKQRRKAEKRRKKAEIVKERVEDCIKVLKY